MSKSSRNSLFHLNIGTIVFSIIFIYLSITIITNFMKERISVCRVEEGQIVNGASFNGVCLRNEAVTYSSNEGYINYYIGDGKKVSRNGKVYLLSTNPPTTENNTSPDVDQSYLDYAKLRDQIMVFSNNYSDSQYAQIHSLHYSMQSLCTEMFSASKIKQYESDQVSGKVFQATDSGIISYSYDNYETLQISDVTKKIFSDHSYEVHQINPFTYIKKGDIAYKTVFDHIWNIVIPLTDAQCSLLKDTTSVYMTFKKDNITTIANFYIHTGSDGSYGVFTLNDYMVRYLSERFVDIEIEFEKANGLKIPTSSLAEKDFYKIPKEFLVEDADGTPIGFYCEHMEGSGKSKAKFITTGIYYQDEDYFYVSTSDYEIGDYIKKEKASSEEDYYRIGATEKIDGVFSINRGYTQFKIVEILHKNKDYCIVQENVDYSISLYDNIVLNGAHVKENQVVY